VILAVQTSEQARARSESQPDIVLVCREVCDALREAISAGKCRLNQLPLPLGVPLEGVTR
jgi:hypothetical protein